MGEAEDLDFSLEYAAAGCNRRRGSMCTLPSQRIAAYAACSNVIIVRDAGRHVCAALPAHKSLVTSVVLVEDESAAFLAVSAADGAIALWRCSKPVEGDQRPWEGWARLAVWKAHSAAVVACDGFWDDALGDICVSSAGLDSRLCLWRVSRAGVYSCASECRLLDENLLRTVLPECVSMQRVPVKGGSAVLICVGGAQKSLQLFACDRQLKNLCRTCSLRGHGDWILSVALSGGRNATDKTLIATASKDCSVRVWSVASGSKLNTIDESLMSKSHLHTSFSWGGLNWVVSEVALLQEHTAAVQSVQFENMEAKTYTRRLMSASTDGSIALWKASEDDKWHCDSRFGLIGDFTKSVGFFGAVLLSKGVSDVLAHSFGGALHCWRSKNHTDEAQAPAYHADAAPGGHSGPVQDGDWGPQGMHFLSCSNDKTVQIVQYEDGSDCQSIHLVRPQVHGHAVQAVAFCDSSSRTFVSGAEESMLRLFQAPKLGASMPELGLSSKAVVLSAVKPVSSVHAGSESGDTAGKGLVSGEAVLEAEPESKPGTLWPETAKLYGHGNPISCVAVCTQRGVLASACMAQRPRDASIFLWDLSNGMEMTQLPVHDRTVTRMSFSQDGLGLLSVSKDRSFALHSGCDEDPFKFRLVHRQTSAHTRQLYDGAWLFNRDFVATGGRDRTLRFFSTQDAFKSTVEPAQSDMSKEVACLSYSCGVSAVHAANPEGTDAAYVAAGFEDGTISVFHVRRVHSGVGLEVKPLSSVPAHVLCSGRISKVQWRPLQDAGVEAKPVKHLAVTSVDHSVRVLRYRVDYN